MQEIMKKIPRKTSTGDNNISYLDLLDGQYYTVHFLLKIVNLTIETGHWSRQCVNSIIMPLFKGGEDWLDAGGYRPVALTCAIAQIVERVLNKQLMDFILEKGITLEENHGFTPGPRARMQR